MSRSIIATIIIATLLLLTACAAGPNQLAGTADANGHVAGFWSGLWHGFIALFTFVISLFSDGVKIYEVHNSGGWYDFGFLLGVMMFFGGGGEAGRRGGGRRR